MSEFKLDKAKILKATAFALAGWSLETKEKMVLITPRDPARPPKNRNAKVTGSLKRSIDVQRVNDWYYRVGIIRGFANTEEYGYYLEFGTVRMAPRSFLRKTLTDTKASVQKTMQKLFSQYLASQW